METKIKDYQARLADLLRQLRDVRVIGLLLFLVILLMMSWSGVKVIETNYSLQKQISQLQQQKDLQQLSNTNLKLTNEYYQSNQYLDIMARQNFGLAAPGETVLVVPQHVAAANTVDRPDSEQTQKQKAAAKQPFYQRNFQAWMNFFLHRQNTQ